MIHFRGCQMSDWMCTQALKWSGPQTSAMHQYAFCGRTTNVNVFVPLTPRLETSIRKHTRISQMVSIRCVHVLMRSKREHGIVESADRQCCPRRTPRLHQTSVHPSNHT
jgi:hypothetical protein